MICPICDLDVGRGCLLHLARHHCMSPAAKDSIVTNFLCPCGYVSCYLDGFIVHLTAQADAYTHWFEHMLMGPSPKPYNVLYMEGSWGHIPGGWNNPWEKK